MFGEIFRIVNIYQSLTCNTKEKLGGAILKSLSFGTGCADFAEIFFKSHVITKYKKSILLSVCLLLKKNSNHVQKTLWVLRTSPKQYWVNICYFLLYF